LKEELITNPFCLDSRVLFESLNQHLNSETYVELVGMLEHNTFDVSEFCSLVQKNYNEKDENAIEKTLYFLTTFGVDSISPFSHEFSDWAYEIGKKHLTEKNEKIVFSFLPAFISIQEQREDFNFFLEYLKKQGKTPSDPTLFFFETFIEFVDEENLLILESYLQELVLKTSNFKIFFLYLIPVNIGTFIPKEEDSILLIDKALEMMLENEGNPWDIEKFSNMMKPKEFLDNFSKLYQENETISSLYLKKFQDFIELKIENKKYEDWKYICVGIYAIGYCVEFWKSYFSKDLEKWINLILSSLKIGNDFIKCSVVETIALLCTDCVI
jgi:hypothetical protein